MIKQLSHMTIYVLDLDKARDFDVDKLGFEVRMDAEMDGFRWLTVGPIDQLDVEFPLIVPGAPMMSDDAAEALRGLIAQGAMGTGVFRTDDCQATYSELSARGVTFLQAPEQRPYGLEATFRDDSGNWFSLTQPAT